MRTVDKPWGHELIWAETPRYVGKILHIKRGEQLSLQYHRVKDETIMVLSGLLRFEHWEDGAAPGYTDLKPHEPFHIHPGLRHRMIALEDTDGDGRADRRVLRVPRYPPSSGAKLTVITYICVYYSLG